MALGHYRNFHLQTCTKPYYSSPHRQCQNQVTQLYTSIWPKRKGQTTKIYGCTRNVVVSRRSDKHNLFQQYHRPVIPNSEKCRHRQQRQPFNAWESYPERQKYCAAKHNSGEKLNSFTSNQYYTRDYRWMMKWYQRNKMLHNLPLFGGKTTFRYTTNPGTTHCKRPKCKTCSHVCTDTEVRGPKARISIRRHFSCTTSNLVYAILCTKCSKLYIGETERTLDARFRQHYADITRGRHTSVARHFTLPGHFYQNIKVMGLWKIYDSLNYSYTARLRKLKESELIQQLGTKFPFGLNCKM